MHTRGSIFGSPSSAYAALDFIIWNLAEREPGRAIMGS
jgi:hypothetical protein